MKKFLVLAAMIATALIPIPQAEAAYLKLELNLYAGDSRTRIAYPSSTYEEVLLSMQSDGNLVLYGVDHQVGVPPSYTALWASNTYGNPGAHAHMQPDGHFVIYSADWSSVLYQSNTGGHPGAVLVFSADGKLKIFDVDSSLLWQSWNSSLVTSSSAFRAPFSSRFADNKYHSWDNRESTYDHYDDWQWRFEGPGAEGNFEPSDLQITEWTGSSNPYVDVYFYQTTDTPGLADTWCRLTYSSTQCDQWRIRFGNDLAAKPSHQKTNGVCHEFGHTVGFRDGGLQEGSCMTGGDNNDLTSWEIADLNGQY